MSGRISQRRAALSLFALVFAACAKTPAPEDDRHDGARGADVAAAGEGGGEGGRGGQGGRGGVAGGGGGGTMEVDASSGMGGRGDAGPDGRAGQDGAVGGDAASDAGGGGRMDASSSCLPGVYKSAVLDAKTCLAWQAVANPPATNVAAAKLCDELVLDGFSDWRVPAPEELATWPGLPVDSNAYVTNPTYVPAASTDADGCTGNSHSCNLTQYNAGALGCAWQGVGFTGKFVCVRGTAKGGTTLGQYAASACEACRAHVVGSPAEFRIANCLPYAK